MSRYLKGIIDRFDGDFIVIKTEYNKEIYWPQNLIDCSYDKGDQVNIYLTKEDVIEDDQASKAKNILRQIFQPNV